MNAVLSHAKVFLNDILRVSFPIGKGREKEYTLLVITADQGGDNLVHLSIAIGNAFEYCVGCERAGVRWR